jgi:signal transduction histidine kinase
MIKILILENDPEIGANVKESITYYYPEVKADIIFDTSDARNCILSLKYDFIIVDLNHPCINYFAASIISSSENNEVPILTISRYTDHEFDHEIMNNAICETIPINSDLLENIKNSLSAYLDKTIDKNDRTKLVLRKSKLASPETKIAQSINHRLNNSLMTILGNVQLILSKTENIDPALLCRLKTIEDSAKQIASVTSDISERADRGDSIVNSTDIDFT